MKYLIKQLEQLQQTAERYRENSKLLCYGALETDIQMWEACEARLYHYWTRQIAVFREQREYQTTEK